MYAGMYLEKYRRRPRDELWLFPTELPAFSARLSRTCSFPSPSLGLGAESSSAWGPAFGEQITKQERKAKTSASHPLGRKACLLA